MRSLYALFTLFYSFIISLITLRVYLIRHGVIDKPDPHRAEEVEHLKSRVDLDNEIEEIKKRQENQVKIDGTILLQFCDILTWCRCCRSLPTLTQRTRSRAAAAATRRMG